MIEVSVFTVVVARADAPSVVVLAEKGAFSRVLGASSRVGSSSTDNVSAGSVKTSDNTNASGALVSSDSAVSPGVARDAVCEHELNIREGDAVDPVSFDLVEDMDLMVPQLLPIWIGHSEAEAIVLLLNNQSHSRPLTHDLLASVIGVLGSEVERIIIDKVVGSTFYATVCLNKDGRLIQVDARPSDSIALALRTGARIFIDKDVMNAAAHQVRVKISDGGELLYGSEDEMERFHSFIESISPEDFSL